jgi:hexulose-6-phosphate isomerase
MNSRFDRRAFLKVASASALAPVLGQGTLGAAETSSTFQPLRKALMMGVFPKKGKTIAEQYALIKEAGFEGVEPHGGENQQEVLDALKANGLSAASVCCHTHWKQTLTHPDAAVRKEGIEGVIQTLRDAKAYGAGSILVVPGVVNKDVTYDVAYRRSQESIREIVPLAKELQVRMSIENVWNNFLLSPLEMARFIDEFDSPWVGSHFDIGNVWRYGWPEQWIKVLGKRINRLHFKECSLEKMSKEGFIASFNVGFMEGSNDWKAIMAALREVGYAGGWAISEQRLGVNPHDLPKQVEDMARILAM